MTTTSITSRPTKNNKPGPVDWRADTLARMRSLIMEADPEIIEERKWRKPTNPDGVPVWSHAGIVCTGETYKQVVKLTFAKGAALKDPGKLFNSSLEGNTRRAIDIGEGQAVDAKAFKALIKAAVAENLRGAKSQPSKNPSAGTDTGPASKSRSNKANGREKVVLLSGGNPQIAKGDGDAPVQGYIDAIPVEWKQDLVRTVDKLIVRNVPRVRKAVKWNSPFYGVEGKGYFLNIHVFTRYVKITFFAGASLRPVPPGAGKDKNARWIDVYEGDLDTAQLSTWIKQAAALPGWTP